MQTKKNIHVNFVWVNPFDEIVALSPVHIRFNETGTNFSHNIFPKLTQPHQPGPWKLLVFDDKTNSLLGETLFLITPLYFANKTKITREESQKLNIGQPRCRKSNFIRTQNVSVYEQIIADKTNNEQLKRKIIRNVRRNDKELLELIIDLTSQFWLLEDICNLSELQCNEDVFMKSCSSTHWSSYSLDSKSEID